MSPSSSLLHRALLPGLLLAVLLPAAAQAQAAQAQQAVLLRGPEPVRELLMFPPNPLSAWQGGYGPAGQKAGEEKAWVTVLYTREPLVLPASWQPRRCGSLGLLELTGYEPYSLCYAHPEGYTLFFSFPAPPEGLEMAEAQRCPFVEAFVRRFQLLRGLVKQPQEVPFPGVLDFGGP